MPLQALSAGTSLALCGVAPVAAHCSVLEPLRLPHTHKNKSDKTKVIYNETHKHRLLTCCTQTVAMVGSLEKQDFR